MTATHERPRLEQARRRQRAAIVALARFECARLLRHPAFLLGMTATMLWWSASVDAQSDPQLRYYGTEIGWTFSWVGAMLAAAFVAGRQRFLSDPDLFPAMPTQGGNRVIASALALVGPTLAAAAVAGFVAVFLRDDGGVVLGGQGYSRLVRLSVSDTVQPVLLVTLAGVLGIAVAQLRRHRLAALVFAVVATFVGGTAIWAFQYGPARVLHPFMYPMIEANLPATFSPVHWAPGERPLLPPDQWFSNWREVRFDTAALHWHLVYVVGLILVGVWLARRWADQEAPPSDRSLVIAAVSLLLLGGVVQMTAG